MPFILFQFRFWCLVLVPSFVAPFVDFNLSKFIFFYCQPICPCCPAFSTFCETSLICLNLSQSSDRKCIKGNKNEWVQWCFLGWVWEMPRLCSVRCTYAFVIFKVNEPEAWETDVADFLKKQNKVKLKASPHKVTSVWQQVVLFNRCLTPYWKIIAYTDVISQIIWLHVFQRRF